jgi:hypothetical protein
LILYGERIILKNMKITVKQLRTIIKEEVENAMDTHRLTFRPGMPGAYQSPKDWNEFMARVDELGVSLEDFVGDETGAYRLLSGVYKRPMDNLGTPMVHMALAISKGDIDKLKTIVATAPETLKAGDRAMQSHMDKFRKD